MTALLSPQAANVRISLEQVLELAETHRCWWLGRYPRLSSFRDDILQEARVAAWRARQRYRPELASFATYAFNPMRRAVAAFFEKQGVFRKGEWHWEVAGARRVIRELGANPEARTDRPTLLTEAARELHQLVAARGGSCAERDAEIILRLAMGNECAETARSFGVSKQRAHQVATKWRSQFGLASR